MMLYDPPQQPVQRRLLRDMPAEERPLARLHQCGPGALCSAELLALALGTADGLDLGHDLLQTIGGLHRLPSLTTAELQQIPGVGESLAARLRVIAELGRRIVFAAREDRPRVASPADTAALLMPEMYNLGQEQMRVVLLDTRNYVIGTPVIYVGSLNTAVVRVAELFRPAIVERAAAIILAHNHPSGDPAPSPEDVIVTRQVVQAGKSMDITVLDHVVIGHLRYVSLKERGLGFD
jgi:DNA repair protein RadC